MKTGTRKKKEKKSFPGKLDGRASLVKVLMKLRKDVVTFNKKPGNGTIWNEQNHQELFFNFTAFPGEGYRLISPQQKVRFEIVQSSTGKSALNIQPI